VNYESRYGRSDAPVRASANRRVKPKFVLPWLTYSEIPASAGMQRRHHDALNTVAAPNHNEREILIMATEKISTITVKEALALAERLHARGTSAMFAASPEVAGDLTMGARVIRGMAKSFNGLDKITLNGGA
jgi:hypothetical protein